MTTITDNELRELAREFDEFLYDFCKNNCLSPLAATGVIMARMTNMAQRLGYSLEYSNLLFDIVKLHEESQPNSSSNTGALH
jgi:hypothetical protein